MSGPIDSVVLAATDIWQQLFWPSYKPGSYLNHEATMKVGGLVVPAVEISGLQTVEGYMVATERLGTGVVKAFDKFGQVLVEWSKAKVETWAEADDIRAIDPNKRLVTIMICDNHGRKTLLRHSLAVLEHNWTVEKRPENVLRVERSDGLSWAFTFNPISNTVIASWIYPPEDDDAEALTAAEFAAALN